MSGAPCPTSTCSRPVDPGNRAARALGIDAPGGVPLGFGLLGYDEAIGPD